MPRSTVVLECRSHDAATLDAIGPPLGWVWLRLRSDRGLLITTLSAPPGGAPELDVLVVDVSDGYVSARVSEDAMRGLTACPAACSDRPWAGEVAGVPAIALPEPGGWTVLVAASHEAHLATASGLERLGPVFEPEPLEAPA